MRNAYLSPALAISVIACAAWTATLAQPGGGFLDGLGPPGDKKGPDPADTSGGQRPPAPRPPRAALPTSRPPSDADLEAAIAAARELAERLRNTKPEEIPELSSVEEAQQVVERYRRLAEQLGPDLDADERAAAAALKQRTEAFEAKYRDRREALESGRKPDGMTAVAWARLRDNFAAEREVLAAEAVAMRQNLERRRTAPSMAQTRLREAEAALQTVRTQGAQPSPELRRRLHETRVALAERRLRELEQVKQERAGQESGRSNPATASTIYGTGDWYIDTMDWLARTMATANSGPPPADMPPGAGLPLPGGEAGRQLTPRRAQEAKVRWTARRITILQRELESAEATISEDDALQLTDFENDLKEQERLLDPVDRPARALQRIKQLDALKAEQQKTRAARLEEYRQRLRREIDVWGEALRKEQEELAKIPADPPAPRPAPPPEGTPPPK